VTILYATVWMTSHLAKPLVRSPLDYGWQKGNNGIEPVLFTDMMSPDFLQDPLGSHDTDTAILLHLL
jgi:hypothetical protein